MKEFEYDIIEKAPRQAAGKPPALDDDDIKF
jgi:hypothetical protein